jgi:hypothetical protein
MNSAKRTILMVAAFCICAGIARAQAVINESLESATLYVDVVNGNDNNSGSQADPFQTIGKAVAMAEANNQSGIGTHVYINPGLYRESINLKGTQQDTLLPETFEAVTPGTAVVTGADPYTNWTQYSGNGNIYSTPWTFNFGQCPALLGTAPPQTDILLRREMAIVNGTAMEQVMSLNQMLEGTFYVDDSGQQLYLWPPAGTDLSSADVELADRGPIWDINSKNGVVLRGLTFEYSSDCKSEGAVEVTNSGTQNVLFDTDNFLWNNASGLHLFEPANYTVQNSVANHNGAVGVEAFDTLNGLWQNDTADYNNWRGGQGGFFAWAEGGINPFSLVNGTFTNINTDWNLSTGIHWDTDNENTVATNINARSNFFGGVELEKNNGPMTLTNVNLCYNSTPGLTANGARTTSAGLVIRDSENVTLSNSLMYGNGNGQIDIIGEPGGIPILLWQTGQIVTVFTENIINTSNIIDATDPTQATLRDSYLNGDDWTLFQSTLNSQQNTWWNGSTDTPFVLPVPTLDATTDFPGWQSATGQDLNSTFGKPAGDFTAQCSVTPDLPDVWPVMNNISLTLDASGQATSIYTYVPIGGFNSTLNLTMDGITGIPGASATLTPTAIPNGAGSSVFALAADTTIAPGTYQFTVLANSGSTTRTATAFLIVPQTSIRISPTVNPNFGSVQVGQQSAPQTLTISNFGKTPVTSLAIGAAPAGFTYTTKCGAFLAAGKSCTLTITFAPNAGAPYNSPLTITDSDPTSPQTITLIGTGIAAAMLSQSASTLRYGPVVYGLSATQTETLTNIGTVTATFSPAFFTGSGASSYSETNNCEPSLAVGDSCNYTVTFSPQALGTLGAVLNIPDNTEKGSTTVTVTGTGKTAVTFSTLKLTYGNVPVMDSSSKTTTLTNAGNALPVTFTLSDTVNYSQTNTCGTTVPAMGSCTITVTFAPQSVGPLNATLTVTDSDPSSPQVVTLTGSGIDNVTTIKATPMALTYGNVPWGTSSSKAITLTNTGNLTALFSSFTFTGAGASDYSQTNNCAPSLAPHGKCTVTVTFTPQVLGSLPATLTIVDNNTTGSNIITEAGTGVSSVILNPANLTFNSVEEGKSSTKTTTLKNLGNALAVTITLADKVNYSQTNTCGGMVPAKSSCAITVTFAPQTTGPLDTTLSVGDGDPSSPQTVTITGTGLSDLTTVTVNPGLLTYQTVVWGLSATKTVTVKNTGAVDAILGAFTFSGAPDYTQTNNCPASLAPKASCSVMVTFTPNALGPLDGSLSFTDNTAAGSSTINMTGTGKTSITISPVYLTFGHQQVGTSSAPKTTTFTNAGNAIALTISLGGADPQDWSYTTTCGPTVPAQGSCTVSVTFTPQTVGSLSANVVFTDADPSSPQITAMTGSGT